MESQNEGKTATEIAAGTAATTGLPLSASGLYNEDDN